MDYYDILLAEKLSGGGGSSLKYGSPLVMACGSCNFFDNTLYLDYSGQSGITRRSIWQPDGVGIVKNYASTSSTHTENSKIKLIPIPVGSTKVKVKCDFTCQISLGTFTISNDTATSMVDNSGWTDITANQVLSYNISSNTQGFGMSFRVSSNNEQWVTSGPGSSANRGGSDYIYSVEIEFE